MHVDFTNKRVEHKPIYINHQVVPYENTAKYMGTTLDAKLRWKPHVKKKQEELILKYRKMYWLMGSYSALSVYNKLMLYQQILKPVWTYCIQLWGCASQSNRNIIQSFQNRVLRGIVNAPGTFEMTIYIKTWMWKLLIASSKSMLKVMKNDFSSTLMLRSYNS